MKKVYINNRVYELNRVVFTMHERDDEDMPPMIIYTALNLSQGEYPWSAVVEYYNGTYDECCLGGYGSEKELAFAIYNSFLGMTTADFLESDLFD